MATLKELLAQKAEIERQIDDAARNERAEAIAKVRALMAEHGLTQDQVETGRIVISRAARQAEFPAQLRSGHAMQVACVAHLAEVVQQRPALDEVKVQRVFLVAGHGECDGRHLHRVAQAALPHALRLEQRNV